MTEKEAIEYIKSHCNPNYPNGNTKWETVMNMAIKALEKQIPMKPKNKELATDDLPGTYIIPCGCCGEAINFLHSYCPWCGQAIDCRRVKHECTDKRHEDARKLR